MFDVDEGISRGLWSYIICSSNTKGKRVIGSSKSYGGVCSTRFQHQRPDYHPYVRSLQIPKIGFSHSQHLQLSHHHGLDIHGHFNYLTTMVWTSMGTSVISQPCIRHPWVFQLPHHHALDINGHFSYLTTMDWTSMCISVISHHRFSSMDICYSYLTTIDFHVWTFDPIISQPWVRHP